MNENFSDITAEALTALYSVAVKNKAIDTENLTLNVPKFKESLELLKDELDKIYIANIEAKKYSVFNENFYLINKEVEDWKIKLEGMEAENFKKRLELKILQKKDEYGEWFDICGTNDNGSIVIEEFCTQEEAKKYLARLVEKLNSGRAYILEQAIEQAGKWYE